MLEVAFFLAFFVIILQAIFCRCILLCMLAGILLLCSLNAVFAEKRFQWVHLLTTTVCIALLGALVCQAFWLNETYQGNIVEYPYAGIVAIIGIAMNVVSLLPEGKTQPDSKLNA